MHRQNVTRVSIVLVSGACAAVGCSSAEHAEAVPGGPGAPASATPSAGGGAASFGAATDASAAASAPGTTCSAPIAPNAFTGALCACNDVNVQGYLRTRGFNSLAGAPDASPNLGGAAVGVNHDYAVAAAGANAGFTDVGGSFAVAGSVTKLDGFLSVDGDLRSAQTVDVIGYTLVSRDAWIGGDLLNTGFAQVGRNLYIAGTDILPAVVGGSRVVGPVTVPPPCACDPSQLLDIGALVAAAKTSNDDAAQGLDPDAWSALVGDAQIALPPGRYYVNAIHGVGDLVIHASGAVAIYVAGNVDPVGRFAIELEPLAEVDLFVQGDLQLTGYSALGDVSRPYATRIYTATTGVIDLTGYETFVGNLYAPWAQVTSKGFVDVWGSFFVHDFLAAGFANFAYDLAVGSAGGACAPAPGPGSPCTAWSCPSGQTCVDGACGACQADGDCPGALVCQSGVCTALPPPSPPR